MGTKLAGRISMEMGGPNGVPESLLFELLGASFGVQHGSHSIDRFLLGRVQGKMKCLSSLLIWHW